MKRIVSILLSVALMVTSVDFTVFAVEQSGNETIEETQKADGADKNEENGQDGQILVTDEGEIGNDEKNIDKEDETFSEEHEIEQNTIELSEEMNTHQAMLKDSAEHETDDGTVNENETDLHKMEMCTDSEYDVIAESETEQLNEESVLDLKSSNNLNEAVKNRILSFKTKYPENSIWGNEFNGWYQCCGFALKLGSEVFNGHWPRTLRSAANGTTSDGWTCYWVNSSNCNSLVAEPGDIIDCPSGTSKSHTAMVLSVDNGKITCVQANYPSRDGANNKVHWTEYFNYNSNRSTLAAIYNVYGVTNAYIQNDGINNTRKFRLWKPSDELKRNATGIAEPEPHACDFSGSFTVETDNGDKVYSNKLKISGNLYDYYGLSLIRISIFRGGYTNYVYCEEDVNTFNIEYTMPFYDDYTISVTGVCKKGITHELGKRTITYCNSDSVPPTVSNVTVLNTGSELLFKADATDNIGITDAWMVAKDDRGNEHRFEASVSENRLSGKWSSGYFTGSNITITVYAKDAGGNIGTDTLETNMGGVTITPKILYMEVNEKAEINAIFDTLYFVKSAGFANEDSYNLLNVETDGLKAQITALKPGFTAVNFSWIGEVGPREIGGDIIYGGGIVASDSVCIYIVPNAPVISSVLEGEYDTIRYEPVNYAETYALYRKVDGVDNDYQLATEFADDGTHSVKVKCPDNGTKYLYRMCAKSAAVKDLNQAGHPMYYPTSEFSNEAECTKKSEIFRVKNVSNENTGSVYIEAYPLKEAASYDIYRYTENENRLFLGSVTTEEVDKNGGLIKYTDTGIKEVDTYYYEIHAISKADILMEILKFSCFVKNVGSDDKPSIEQQGDGLWISWLETTEYFYLGEPLKPVINVYDKDILLTEKKDYIIAYKNNLNVGKATITVTGKGNYSGKETATFNILPADISDDDFSAEEFYVKVGNKAQYPIPELYYMGTKLKHKKDFTINYSNTSGVYNQVGEYRATITGTGNYRGTREIKLTAVETIAKKSSMSIAKASLVGFEKSFPYTGKAHKQDCTLYIKTSEGEKALIEGVDYTVRYANNTKAGTATVTYSGKNGYTGKLKKTYKITPYNISDDYEAKIIYENYFECVYAMGGIKPKPVITFDQKVMKEGVDYTLSYKNNKEVYGKQTPCVVVNGKGSFKGRIPIYFTITPQDLSKMTLVSCDKVYKNKAGNHKIVPKLMDFDGKLLSAGKDFDKNNITYTYENDVMLENGIEKKAGDPVDDTDILPADTQIRVAFGCGTGNNYTGTFTGVYRIVKADIKSAKVTILNQTYTGKEIILDKAQITVTLSGTTLKPEDYEILQYTDNVKKGKASVTIKGNGNYGGTKTVKFNIGAKGFLWWKTS